MKDLHSHLLYGIDDGCNDLEESIAIIKKASEEGISDIMLTPHYIDNSQYNCNNKDKKERFNRLKEEVQKRNININLYLGNEVYITDDFISLIQKQEIMTLNNSNYLLVEFPMGNMTRDTKTVLYNLIVMGCVPVIAHPERYSLFQRHPEFIEELISMGALLQGNYKSLFGKYGKESQKTLKYFLQKGWITFLGSDCHHDDDFRIDKLEKELKSIVKDEKVIDDLLRNNFDKVINNLDIGIKR